MLYNKSGSKVLVISWNGSFGHWRCKALVSLEYEDSVKIISRFIVQLQKEQDSLYEQFISCFPYTSRQSLNT